MEINTGAKKNDISKPQNWKYKDRSIWRSAKLAGTETALNPDNNSFIRAAIYNTQNNRPQEYRTISERHDYYYLIQHLFNSGKTTTKLKSIRFFHAAALITGHPGVGTIEFIGGYLTLSNDSRNVLKEMNKVLFEINMGIIHSLLLKWKSPRNLKNNLHHQEVTPINFDISMVDLEQKAIENFIKRNQLHFTVAVIHEINCAINIGSMKSPIAPLPLPFKAFKWAKKTLRVSKLDFMKLKHRTSIGLGIVFLLHKKNFNEYDLHITQITPNPEGHIME